VIVEDVPARFALNARLRDDFLRDCLRGLQRWNQVIHLAGFDFTLTLPHVAFNRRIGSFAHVHAAPDGRTLDLSVWAAQRDQYLPSADDQDFIMSLMIPELTPGRFATWIAPPRALTDNRPGDFEYIKVAS
jgi:benzoyl-CoA 2,3-dioxygenase component B